jgi:hypothetical protein
VPTQPKAFLTPEEYLEIERKAEYKSEYWNGQMFPLGEPPSDMAGAREQHSLIAMHVGAELDRQFRDRPCRVYANDMRVHTHTPEGSGS